MTAEAIVYPDTMGGFPPCRGCWEPGKETARTLDPRDGDIKPLCADCGRALVRGAPLAPMTEQAWEELARLHQNREGVTDDDVAWALSKHAGHLSTCVSPYAVPAAGWDAFEQLKDALLREQEADDPMFDPATLDPQWRDAETYAIHCRGLVEDATAKLTGGQ